MGKFRMIVLKSTLEIFQHGMFVGNYLLAVMPSWFGSLVVSRSVISEDRSF